MADEVIRIDTRIDINDAERDLDSLKKKLKETSNEGKEGFKKANTEEITKVICERI